MTSALGFDGYRVVQHRGVVRGIVVPLTQVVGSLGASIQMLFGGNITLYTELCEHARQDAFDLMMRHGAEVGANAIIAMRYDANEVASGATEELAYGTPSSSSRPDAEGAMLGTGTRGRGCRGH